MGYPWLINRGDPNHLHPLGWSSKGPKVKGPTWKMSHELTHIHRSTEIGRKLAIYIYIYTWMIYDVSSEWTKNGRYNIPYIYSCFKDPGGMVWYIYGIYLIQKKHNKHPPKFTNCWPKKIITLLRVIPTMTCWVEVVRWGLSLRI